ncbi:MAG: hypothetical protein LBS36_01455 [Oscillospiraceae bacterium]|jgi:hypothetical protein|nr:hypothetical protein [Oscillospiraceae bacterium]
MSDDSKKEGATGFLEGIEKLFSLESSAGKLANELLKEKGVSAISSGTRGTISKVAKLARVVIGRDKTDPAAQKWSDGLKGASAATGILSDVAKKAEKTALTIKTTSTAVMSTAQAVSSSTLAKLVPAVKEIGVSIASKSAIVAGKASSIGATAILLWVVVFIKTIELYNIALISPKREGGRGLKLMSIQMAYKSRCRQP